MLTVNRHVEGPSHVNKSKEKERQLELVKSNKKITDLFSTSGGSKVTNHDMDVMRAEAYFVEAVVEMNLPMASLDTLIL
jgi:hypothetical protein